MSRKLGPDAFAFYAGLGPARSYQAVAERFGSSKQSVARAAKRDDWQGRLAEWEEKRREESESAAAGLLQEMEERHEKFLRAIQAKAIETLRTMPLTTAMEAIRALDLSIKQERLLRGEPSERSELSVEAVTQREIARWLDVDREP